MKHASARVAAASALLGLMGLAGDEAAPFDPLFASGAFCAPTAGGPPPLLRALVLAQASTDATAPPGTVPRKSETAPFQPPAMQAAPGEPRLYGDLGALTFKLARAHPQVQAFFDQGLRLAFAFNHAEAQRAFRAAQRLDPNCALCFWGEALILGPNINVPMMPEAVAPAWAALSAAVALKDRAAPKERALIEALEKRYAEQPPVDRAPLDAAYADAMRALAQRHPGDDLILTLHAEATMDTQPWDYWEAAGARPKGRAAEIVRALETVLARNPRHAGAIHLYIHAVEASTAPERALPHARRLAALMPGAGHIVHMPAHIYFRVGLYRESLEANRKAIAADERYFETSPSDPLYRAAYYPHNIHFVMVSAQMGGDAATALAAAAKLDAALPPAVVQGLPMLQPVKAAPYTIHAQFGAPEQILALPAPTDGFLLVDIMYRYARVIAQAQRKDVAGAQQELAALTVLVDGGDFKPFEAWGVPARAIAQTARLVAIARVADAKGDLDAAARAFDAAIAVEDTLAYTEPPFWYYPVRQSLGALRLRQGRLDDAERALRDSLARVRNNGWALAALVEVYRQKGDAKAERAARAALARTWLGAKGPELARL